MHRTAAQREYSLSVEIVLLQYNPLYIDTVWNDSLRNNLIVSNGLVDPVPQVGHTSVHGRSLHIAVRSAPGHNTHEGPHTTPLTDQRATRITLKMTMNICTYCI